MSNQFAGFGNVGAAPTLRQVTAGGELRAVAEMRVYFDRRVPKGGGAYEDQGGFWLTVSVWGARAEAAAHRLQKGARVQVVGTLRQETWKDTKTQAERSELRLSADSVTIDLGCVESISYKPRRTADAALGAKGPAADAPPLDTGEDIAF
jgi:single-strand DNA-binding protein